MESREPAIVASHGRRFAWRAAVLAAAVALAGCMVGPVDKPDVPLPAAWRHAPADTAQLGPAPDLRGWWHAFDDPVLDRLIDAALAGNLDLREAVYRIDAARALSGKAASAFRPTIGAHTFAEPTPDSSASYFQGGFDAKWELGLFGRASGTARVAAAEVGAAESDAEAARVSVVAEVARDYIELRGAEARVKLLADIADAAKQKTDLIATRERLHLATAAGLARSQAEQAGADAALAEPRLAIDRCRQQLALLLGRSELPDDLLAPGSQPGLGALRVAEAPADLLRTRPEIRRAEQDILKAAGELGIAHADLFPQLALGGSLTYSARVIGHTRLSDADGIVTFGPLIDVPIFDWGARRDIESARDAELKAAIVAYRKAVLEGVAEAETAMAALERQRERAADLSRAVAGYEKSDAATATLRRLGLADGIDGADAKSALLQARVELAHAEEARNLAFIAVYKALGGAPLPPSATLAESTAR